jgi:hypothetical protein
VKIIQSDPMNFRQFSSLEAKITTLFRFLEGIQNEKFQIQIDIQGEINFLGVSWKGIQTKKNEFDFFSTIDDEIYHVRIFIENNEKIIGEIYQQDELAALFQVIHFVTREEMTTFPPITEDWILKCLKNLKFDVFDLDTLLVSLGISQKYSKILKDQGINLKNVKYLTDDELSEIFENIGDRLALRYFFKSNE